MAGAERAATGGEAAGVKAYLRVSPHVLREDGELLAELGLRLDAANMIDFGPVALSRVSAAHARESSKRQRLEAVAQANYVAQAQTHAAVIDILKAADHTDLARRVDALARRRFALAAGVIALEGPAAVPEGWRALAAGQVDLILGPRRRTRMGHLPTAVGLFEEDAGAMGSVALIRLGLWGPRRRGVMAFGAADPAALTADMGAELVTFLARVVERTAARWPAP